MNSLRFFFPFLLVLSLPLCAAEEEDETTATTPLVVEDENTLAAADNLGPPAQGFLPDPGFGPDTVDTSDLRVLRDFIESRGLIKARKCEGCLTLAGDVRAKWNIAGEKVNGRKVRGTGTETALNLFRSEVNLFFDYVAPRTWVSTKLRFSVFLGTDGGTLTKVDTDRAFIGYDIYECDPEDFYIEVGRSRLDYIFDSRVEFSSFFDGIHLYYINKWDPLGIYVIHGGPFIVDSFTNHYAWVAEATLSCIDGTGLYVKYSYIDWKRRAPTLYYGKLGDNFKKKRFERNPRFMFKVSQLLVGYEGQAWCRTLILYFAGLKNHAAIPQRSTNFKKANGAWYIGFTYGKLCKGGDWSIDLNYQSVGALAVPEFDLAGFGHGNALGTLISDAILQNLNPFNTRGFTNYRGPEFSFLYAMSESLSLQFKARYSVPLDRDIGGNFTFKAVEMAVIYAW